MAAKTTPNEAARHARECAWNFEPLQMDDIERVLAAWKLFPGTIPWPPPATPRQLAAVEDRIGRPLSASLRRIYEVSDGVSPLDGNLMFEPTEAPNRIGLAELSDRLREWKWPIPDEVFMFASDGSDSMFGLWCPRREPLPDDPPVVEVGKLFEPACLVLVGTRFSRFLKSRSGYYLAIDAPDEVLDVIEVPEELRNKAPLALSPFFAWADPDLPDYDPDPYKKGLDARAIADLVTRLP